MQVRALGRYIPLMKIINSLNRTKAFIYCLIQKR